MKQRLEAKLNINPNTAAGKNNLIKVQELCAGALKVQSLIESALEAISDLRDGISDFGDLNLEFITNVRPEVSSANYREHAQCKSRVDEVRLDTLINVIGELVLIFKERFESFADLPLGYIQYDASIAKAGSVQ